MNIKNIELTISRFETKEKPKSDNEKAELYKMFKKESISVEELNSFYNSDYSYTISPAIFKNDKVNDRNWESQKLVFIDFDKGMTYNEAIKCCEYYKIMPIIKYDSYSSTESKERFRLIFALNKEVKDKAIMKKILNTFEYIFNNQCDGNALNVSSYYFGGRNGTIIGYKEVDVNKILELHNINMNVKYKGKKKMFIELEDDDREIITDKNYFKFIDEDWDVLYENCRIYKDFVDGKWLYHPQLRGIAMNMQIIEGGAKRYKEIFKNHMDKFYSYDSAKMNMVDYFRKKSYNAQTLSSFSDYEDDYQYNNFIEVVKQNRKTSINKIEQIDVTPQTTISLKKGEEIFKEEIIKIQNDNSNNIYIINCPPGFGKTHYLSSLAKSGTKNVYIASSYHRIIDDITKDMSEDSYNRVNPVPEFNDLEINANLELLYNQGDYRGAKELIENNRNKVKNIKAYEKYLKNDDLKYWGDKPYFTTINREINIHNAFYKTVYFDEDPINEIAKVETLKMSVLKSFFSQIKEKKSKLYSVLKDIIESKKNKIYKTENIICSNDRIEQYKGELNINIRSLLSSYAYYIDENTKTGNDTIYYISHKMLNEECKYVIFSATPNIDYYTKIYDKRVKILDLSNIEPKGKLYQYANKSYSKQCLKDEEFIDILNENIGNTPVVTYKDCKDKFSNPSSCYFGNLYGSNDLNDQEIAIVGINRYENPYYILFAYLMGIESKNGYEMKYQKVEYNGYRFNFMTFIDPDLRKIHLDITNGEMIQAVGRGRLLRTDNIVNLYCGFPLKGASQDKLKY